MKNRDRFVGLRPQEVKVYPCRVLMENGQPVERVINITTATAISRENRKQAKVIVKARPKGPSKTPRAWLSGMTEGPAAPNMGRGHFDPERDMSAEWEVEYFAIHTDGSAGQPREEQ